MKRIIAFVAYSGLTLLDLVGPLQVLSEFAAVVPGYSTKVVGESVDQIDTDTGMRIIPESTFEQFPSPSVIIVPGGGKGTRDAMKNGEILAYVAASAKTAEIVASVCTGSLILGAAGLLKGLQATTHWSARNELEELGAKYLQKRWVEDGNIVTAAGVSAGIDMALALVARLAGLEWARYIQLSIEYDPKPPFGGIDWDLVERIRAGKESPLPRKVPHRRSE